MFHLCRRRKLSLDVVPTQYTRSRNYRNEFFAKNKTVSGKYRCAYCGRKLAREKITIDHIFSVHCMDEHLAVRRRAALFGIRGSNDLKNLVPDNILEKGWISKGNHNFLRLTRIMESLQLFELDNHYKALKECLLVIAAKYPEIIGEKTRTYWEDC